jgi:hypothetical protein
MIMVKLKPLTYQNLELIKEYDLKTKGLGSNFDSGELFKELIYKLTH